jgi:hypothetical protein
MVKQILLMAVVAAGALAGGQQARADDYVRGYVRSNGTYVAPYFRTHPDHNFYNNWSTYPNINPYTGQLGTHHRPSYWPRNSYPSYRSPSFSPSYGRRR